LSQGNDKSKPIARWGRKAMGLQPETAKPPKASNCVLGGFLFADFAETRVLPAEDQFHPINVLAPFDQRSALLVEGQKNALKSEPFCQCFPFFTPAIFRVESFSRRLDTALCDCTLPRRTNEV
jgi:hypothetical protein